MNGKPPLQPATHPQPKTPKAMLVIASVVFGLAVIGGAVAYAEMARPAWIFGTKAGATPTPKPYTLGAEVTPSPEATPTPAPTPDLAVRNAHRQADLAAFAAAYKASAVKGYYPVKPPAVNVLAADPTTGAVYAVTLSEPTAIGQIRYWAGGSCTGAAITPGVSGTKHLAVQTMLESGNTLYCLDVK